MGSTGLKTTVRQKAYISTVYIFLLPSVKVAFIKYLLNVAMV